jgi:hypothetical protein
MAFAKLKAALRAAQARTIPDLCQAIADALRRLTPQECANHLAASGYDANLSGKCLSYDNSRWSGEKEPLGKGGCPLVSGEGRIGIMLTV